MVDIPFLLGGGGASLAGPQREQQHSHVGPLPCGVFAGQAPLILVDSILILSSCCFRISICAVYLPMYNCGLCSYIHIYIHTHPRAGTYSIFNGVLSHFLRFLRLSKRETWGTVFGTSPPLVQLPWLLYTILEFQWPFQVPMYWRYLAFVCGLFLKAKFQGICPQNLALHFTKVAPF
jgi:hypothetical protein